ncbi:hypothetical protein TorRG33x02_271030 [Trema orientale]|uniref:Uncharacterized protein n=1 Tax=Trema orientale TaxID=63057 RepID=A0A2P5CWC5_TREOI|nr:hypothetical protein TorRG33x02_271030 [Trema orientale]
MMRDQNLSSNWSKKFYRPTHRRANQLTEIENSATTITPAPTETQTQKLERISNELLDLTKLERYDYSLLFCLETGLNRYGPLNAAEKFGFKDLRLISLPS